jgi:hypothetical protein
MDKEYCGSVADPDLGIRASDKWIRIQILLFSPLNCNANKELSILSFSASFLKLHLQHFSKIKSHKEITNSRNQGFLYYFCLTDPDPYL